MLEFLKNTAIFQILSISGAVCTIIGAVIAGVAFRGKAGERYSPLNHYISELGEVGISRFAWVFNLGLILCGVCLLPASISLGLLLPGILSKFGMTAGMISAVSVAMVGVFPLNRFTGHVRAAVTYFRMGLIMIFFFTLAIALQTDALPFVPRILSLAGIPAVLAFLFFLFYPRSTKNPSQDLLSSTGIIRPKIWGIAIAEWFVFLTNVAWFLAISVSL